MRVCLYFPAAGGGLLLDKGRVPSIAVFSYILIAIPIFSYIFTKFLYFTNNCGDLEVCDSLLQNGLCSRTLHVDGLVWVGI